MFRRTYLWFHEGQVLTAAGRVIDTYPTVTEAANAYRTQDGSVIFRLGLPR